MKTKILSSLLLMLFVIIALAQESDTVYTRKPHAIGFTANSFSGFGLTYNYFPKTIGFQFNSFAVMQEKDLTVAFGGSFYYSFKRTERFNVFGHLSNWYMLERKHFLDTQRISKYYDDSIYNIGAGPGVEIIGENFSCILTYGFGFYDNFKTFFTLGGGITFLVLL
jgi:hypothetical protein